MRNKSVELCCPLWWNATQSELKSFKSYIACCCVAVAVFENNTAPLYPCAFYLTPSLLWNCSYDVLPTSWPGHLVREILTLWLFHQVKERLKKETGPAEASFFLPNDSSPPDSVEGSLLKVVFRRRQTSGLTQLQHLQALLTALCHLLKPDRQTDMSPSYMKYLYWKMDCATEVAWSFNPSCCLLGCFSDVPQVGELFGVSHAFLKVENKLD